MTLRDLCESSPTSFCWSIVGGTVYSAGSCSHSPHCLQHSSLHLCSPAIFCLNRGDRTVHSVHFQTPTFHFVHLYSGGFFHYYWWPLSWHFPAAFYPEPNISLPSGSESILLTFEFHLCPHAISYTHPHFLFHLTAQLLITETSSWGSLHLASSFPPRTKLPQPFLL